MWANGERADGLGSTSSKRSAVPKKTEPRNDVIRDYRIIFDHQ
jgi:hypothetical protein